MLGSWCDLESDTGIALNGDVGMKRGQLHGRVLIRLAEEGFGYIERTEDGFLATSGDGTSHAPLTPVELVEWGTELIMHGTKMLAAQARRSKSSHSEG